ncbi:MAG: hypothetical protein HZB55_07505 [Deltaproteobacteria bacterium]|nr:hypothetical protein [Deltaproteobacteria bacterium]
MANPESAGQQRRLDEWCIERIQQQQVANSVHLHVWGETRQGKSIFLGRLALELATKHNYQVLWCKSDETAVPFLDEEADDFLNSDLFNDYEKTLPRRLSRYAPAFLGAKRRLAVFLDDIMSVLQADEEFSELRLQRVSRFIESVNAYNIAVITSGHSEDLSCASSLDPIHLKLTASDRQSIGNKLCEELNLSEVACKYVTQDTDMRKQYKSSLASFFCAIYTHVGNSSYQNNFVKQYIRKYEDLSEDAKEAYHRIAACDLLDLALPQRGLPKLPAHEKRLLDDAGFAGLVLRKLTSGELSSCGYRVGSPYLSNWLFDKRLRTKSDDIANLYDGILTTLLSGSKLQAIERRTIQLILRGLDAGWHLAFLPDVDGIVIARDLYKAHKAAIKLLVEDVSDPNEIVYWAATCRAVGDRAFAGMQYDRAAKSIGQQPEGMELGARISLAMGLATFGREKAREAKSIFAIALEELLSVPRNSQADRSIAKVIDRYIGVIANVDGYKSALKEMQDLEPRFPFDSALFRRKGELLEAANELPRASEIFKRAVETAPNGMGAVIAMQRYAVFLARHERKVVAADSEPPDKYFGMALQISERIEQSEESVLNAWARYEANSGHVDRAMDLYRRAVAVLDAKGFVHEHTLNGYANFLIDLCDANTRTTHDDWLCEAEDCCLRVVEADELSDDRKRHARHILGRLLAFRSYTSRKGERRPDYGSAAMMLQSGFESPEPLRDDDGAKTWHDIVTHQVLARIYVEMFKNASTDENRQEVETKLRFHFDKCVAGLPRADLPLARTVQHVCRARSDFGRTLADEIGDIDAAEHQYAKSIEILETHRIYWELAHKMYLNYVFFLTTYGDKRRCLDVISLLRRALGLEDGRGSIRSTLDLLRRAARAAHQSMLFLLDNGDEASAKPFLDESIEYFERAMRLEPNIDGRAAIELSHILFPRTIPLVWRSSDRIKRIVDVLMHDLPNVKDPSFRVQGLCDMVDKLDVDPVLCNRIKESIGVCAGNSSRFAKGALVGLGRKIDQGRLGEFSENLRETLLQIAAV